MELKPMHKRILAAIKAGFNHPNDIGREAKLKKASTLKALDELFAAGLLEKEEWGYELKSKKKAVPKESCTAEIKFANSQNLKTLLTSFEFFGFGIISSDIKLVKLLPPAGLDIWQIKAEIEAILKSFTNSYSIKVDFAPNLPLIRPLQHLSSMEVQDIRLGDIFAFHMQEYKVVKLVSKKRTSHDLLSMPPYIFIDFITIDEDINLHQFEIDTHRKKGQMTFKKYNGNLDLAL
jgi:hypothetical protein